MNHTKNTLIKTEIEILSGKIYNGDATKIIYDMFKNTTDLRGLILYLTGEVMEDNVCIAEEVKPVIEVAYTRPCFKEWITKFKQL